MSSGQSDAEMSPALPKKAKKTPQSPTSEPLQKQGPKKLSIKEMIHKALSASKSRKGISLYAIKKYMHENFNADIEKINYLIKKNIKESVEAGIIIQTKGVGASGSFRLAPDSKQPKKPSKKPKKPKEATENEERLEKPKKTSKNTDQDSSKPKKTVAKNAATSKPVEADTEESKQPKLSSKPPKLSSKPPKLSSKQRKLSSIKENPKAGTSTMKTPKKKSKNSMMKRRSIGSIIKPPKMKPAQVNRVVTVKK